MEFKIREKSRHKNLKLSIYPDSLVNSEDHDEMQLQWFDLFDLILYVPLNNFSWVEQVLSREYCVLLKDTTQCRWRSRTCNPSVSSQALYHCTPPQLQLTFHQGLHCFASSWQKYTIFVILKNLPVTPSNTKWAILYSIKCMIGKSIRMKRVEHLLANLKLLNWCVSYTEF